MRCDLTSQDWPPETPRPLPSDRPPHGDASSGLERGLAAGAVPEDAAGLPSRLTGLHLHLMAVGGIGMSALARLALAQGARVSGCDCKLNAQTRALQKAGVVVHEGHNPAHVNIGVDLLVYSSAIGEDHPEICRARAMGARVVSRLALLAHLLNQREGIAVTGTHGKTTTTWLAAHLLRSDRRDPTVVVGGVVPELQSNVHIGEGRHFVAEIDESDGKLLHVRPRVSILLNLEHDHVDHYDDVDTLFRTMQQYAANTRPDGVVIACADDPRLQQLIPDVPRRVRTYGFTPEADVTAEDITLGACSACFTAAGPGFRYENLELAMPGRHNVQNALAVVALAVELGIDEAPLRRALRTAGRVNRRFQIKWEHAGVRLVDDYAHHPSELRATLKAARTFAAGGRVVAVFQPHRYSRTARFMPDFAAAFGDADEVIVCDVYAAGEAPIPGVDAQAVVASAHAAGHANLQYVGPRANVVAHLRQTLRAGDVVLTLGAGDITTLGDDLVQHLVPVRAAG